MDKVSVKIAIPFKKLLTEHKRYKVYWGGRAGGKSFAFADCLLLLARKSTIRVACVRETQNSIKDSVYQLLKDRAIYYGFNDFAFYEDRVENVVTGSKFIFKGLKDQNSQNIKSLEGIDICWCFVAGTKVDGKNIEDIKVGDYVLSYDHKSNQYQYNKVLRVMRRKSPKKLYKLLTSDGLFSIIGTGNHPIYVKGKGYTPIQNIEKGDVVYAKEVRPSRICTLFGWLWGNDCDRYARKKTEICQKRRSLLQGLCEKTKFGKNEKEQSNVKPRIIEKAERNIQEEGYSAEGYWRKWSWIYKSTKGACKKIRSWMVARVSNTDRTPFGIADEFQGRYCEYILRDSNRTGWRHTLWCYFKKRGCTKRFVLREQRVESVEIQEQGSIKQLGLSDGGDYVYNLEVQGTNNYFANGLLVHNCEEGQKLSKASWDILDPTIRKEGSEIWVSMNREEENDPIWKAIAANPDDRTLVVKVNYYDNPYCPEEMRYLALKCKEQSPDDYEHIWLGAPVNQGDTKLIAVKDVRKAMENKIASSTSPLIIGVDIARFGDDKTVFCFRQGRLCFKLEEYAKMDTVEVANKINALINELKPVRVFLDMGNNGAGVYDILKDRGYAKTVRGINFGAKAINDDRYFNKRAEMWALANDWLKDENLVQLVNDDELLDDLCSVNKGYDNKGRLQLETKDKVKERIGRSPDKADAFVLTFAEPVYDDGKIKPIGIENNTIESLFKSTSHNTGW